MRGNYKSTSETMISACAACDANVQAATKIVLCISLVSFVCLCTKPAAKCVAPSIRQTDDGHIADEARDLGVFPAMAFLIAQALIARRTPDRRRCSVMRGGFAS